MKIFIYTWFSTAEKECKTQSSCWQNKFNLTSSLQQLALDDTFFGGGDSWWYIDKHSTFHVQIFYTIKLPYHVLSKKKIPIMLYNIHFSFPMPSSGWKAFFRHYRCWHPGGPKSSTWIRWRNRNTSILLKPDRIFLYDPPTIAT
jgi:hypothetical protein